ncbi:class III extradiol ring-cleavage dioxygenase [Psychrosphaera sp. 1_MG-2023]|uniref:DODA-type extradiol aromatic ring-opening family dioxygenase n=1 Tax=Psychrosphaera sp. 1_MG-2023 TaxID=3062643 RepID=UPI0026E2FABE|nr:class III extradiol ring-cleavage dioxygenase [Psychrosphaera sp. 1_MG-2023]MDO6720676.1 class III extradiol ring-cleavage dioxygenase [Psychrosphaera sp. 1_MG-2023]
MSNVNIAFISHGGGPMPLLNDPSHAELVTYLTSLASTFKKPKAILLISAHWEGSVATITASSHPEMIYDYSGFPAAAYQLQYPSPGEPKLATKVQQALLNAGIAAQLDYKRGYDHGAFVPLTLMYPAADIPVIQLSLLNNLDPLQHLAIGKALQSLQYDELLVIGSGFSFHNMREFFAPDTEERRAKNLAFEQWLHTTLSDQNSSESERWDKMASWTNAPYARYCHPREEHLLPLHICYGLAGRKSDEQQSVTVLNKQSSAFVWRSKSDNN